MQNLSSLWSAATSVRPFRLTAFARRLLRDTTAGTTTFVAFAAPVFVGALGVGIDTSVWYIEKRQVQQQADAAALGGARVKGLGQTNATALAVATRDAQRNGFVASASSTMTFNSPPTSGGYTSKSTAVEVKITRQLSSFFSSYLLGGTARSITGRAVGYTPHVQTRNLEVALVLDASSSMNGNTEVSGTTKMEAQQAAAISLINTVVQTNQTPFTSRVALAPFSSSVNVGSTYFQAVTNKTLTGTWSGVVERPGSYKFKDDLPSTANGWFGEFRTKKAGAMGDYASYVQGLSSQTPSSANKIVPLSSSTTALETAVNSLTSNGTTAAHLGLAWAWYQLSPKWNTIFTGTAAPNAYDSATTYKAIVVLSDFDFNSYYESGNGTANAQFDALCTAVKAAGVIIYTIGYGSMDSTANTRRTTCASPGADKTFTASSVESLIDAFEAVAASTVVGSGEGKLRIVE